MVASPQVCLGRPAAAPLRPPSLLAVSTLDVRVARFDELDARTFHDIVRLRVDTFVVEQECPYPELDGRDILPTTQHVWIEEDGEVVAYLRLYAGADDAAWIGRVVTATGHRGRGLGALLMRRALALVERPVHIYSQARLEQWYGRFGFARCGDDFLLDDMLHTPMVLESGREPV
jgi:ElaA protein